jgi:hypothetical protein
MSGCDRCGLEDPECDCYLYELEKRVGRLEEELDKLTDIINTMSDRIRI